MKPNEEKVKYWISTPKEQETMKIFFGSNTIFGKIPTDFIGKDQ